MQCRQQAANVTSPQLYRERQQVACGDERHQGPAQNSPRVQVRGPLEAL